jgi:hypothetical protein
LDAISPDTFRPQRPEALPAREACVFYHSLDFPNGESVAGHWDLRGRFGDYVGGVALAGKSVLDVGTASGFLAFSAEAAGAQVSALDVRYTRDFDRVPFRDSRHYLDRASWAADWETRWFRPLRNGFWYAWHRYASRVEMLYVPLTALPYWDRRFDVVIAGAIVEHVADPVGAIGAWARLARETLVLAFTEVHDSDRPMMLPLHGWRNPRLDHGWWMLSRGLYRRIFENLGFEVEFRRAAGIFNPSFVNDLSAPVLVERPTIIARRRRA